MTRTLLIDGDILAYRIAAAVQMPIEWSEDIWSFTGDLKEAKLLFENQVTEWMKAAKCKKFKVAYTCNPTFRHEMYPEYKANRRGTPKPLLFRPLVDWSLGLHDSLYEPGLEADDLLGLSQTKTSVIASGDKDLKTVPGKHLDLETLEVVTVSVEDADRMLFMQALTGDATDGYSGLKGVGPKTAEKLLGDAKTEAELWEKVLAAYKDKGCSHNDALMSLRLARILRRGEYNFKTKAIALWGKKDEQQVPVC